MFLGIEIGGTKLQVAVGRGDGSPPFALIRSVVDQSRGAEGILEQVADAGRRLCAEHRPTAAGVGFGGPCRARDGIVVKSCHVSGWDGFPLARWLTDTFEIPAAIANDCDAAALAEASFGAGRGADPVLYVTVGTGVGAGLTVFNRIYPGGAIGGLELGHLRPGLGADTAEQNVESFSAGWGIAAQARRRIATREAKYTLETTDLLARAGGDLEKLTTRDVAVAAAAGNRLALEVFEQAITVLGWAIAQAVTLTAPQKVVIGGGVSLSGEELFFRGVRSAIERYVFPPFLGTYDVVAAGLGEEVVLYGALALAAALK